MAVNYMVRRKRETITKSIRFLSEISEALDRYADDQLISINAAVNKLLKEKLGEVGYLSQDLQQNIDTDNK